MSLYENIKFSNDLIENEACNITYSGYLFEKNSTCVSIVYGYGPEWKHTTEQKMEKTDEGFVATINIREFESINFCFKNLDNEWDNNYNQNYTSPISRPVINETQEELQESVPEFDFILNNDDIIKDIIDNLLEIDLSNPIYNEPLQFDTDIVHNEKTTNEPFEIEVEINKPVEIEETLVNSTEIEGLNQDLENMFNEIYEAPVEAAEEFDMNNLINEILSPIVKSTVFDENLENVKESLESENKFQDTTNFFDDFEDFEDDLSVDNKIDSLIADLFNNTKEARENVNVENIESKEIEENNEPLFVENIEIGQELKESVAEMSEELEKSIDNRIEELLSTGPIAEVIEENIVENIEIQEPAQIEDSIDLFEENEVEEESLIESINEEQESTALIELPDETGFTVSPRALSKFYMFRKKVKLAFTKLSIAIPRYLSRGFDSENN